MKKKILAEIDRRIKELNSNLVLTETQISAKLIELDSIHKFIAKLK